MKDPYSVLGLSQNASEADIKKAYRGLAKKHHPDTKPGDEATAEKFKEISAAYALLSNKEMRERYNRGEINTDGSEKGFAGHPGQGGGFGGFGDGFDPEEIFSSFFGGGGARRKARPAKGPDAGYKLTIDFIDAVEGAKKQITLENGKTLNVAIPVNVKEGQQIRLKGQGSPGTAGGPAGDALIEVNIRNHAYFRREGNDIHLELPITLSEAVLGGKVNVPTTHGSVTLSIPKGSSSGKTLRLKGKGCKNAKSGTSGNQYVKLMIMLPDESDTKLEKALGKLGEEWDSEQQKTIRSDFK